MLPRQYRLTDDYDYRRVRRLGKIYQTPFFIISFAPSKDPKSIRFGFIVSKKIDKRAVIRNRVTRLMREMVSLSINNIPLGFDFVFIAKARMLNADLSLIKSAFSSFLTSFR
ncbi:ribonuclease P protein component [candidate division WWE3 bacterium CG_4_10_14_0_2_um_filter_42_7]|uniref:Ribonuclease P protein component n=2 Tax=Katanobacteria TaxID=422282 RepID=A0A2H0X9D5_UNCKA|nr:MAG: ribonuclease P protein component [candidate division WWE3 bacterium CG08_land_8_20_14_0_20_41_15]PIZ43264.1 MAG: ribonuclease P protein component [candidate division WWE3 bacterium CG_4_10_14_0_2_um_filter_42_7]